MRIVHVVPSIDEEASGPSNSVAALNKAMRRAGAESILIATGAECWDADAGIRMFPRRCFPHRLGRSPEMYRWLRGETTSRRTEIVHNNSIWMMPNVYPGWATRSGDATLVVSPRGTFSAWALNRSKARKILFWNALQKRAISHAALFHATAESEYEDIRRLGFRQPVAIIPNGVDLPDGSGSPAQSDNRTLLFLGRLHPVKGLELLIEAWSKLQNSHPQWRLRVVGPGTSNYVRRLSGLASSLHAERVTFEGPLYGSQKQEAYRTAGLFVLPTHSENFGMAVAEALAAGRPVVTTRGAPWGGLVSHRAGWWVEIGLEPLRAALHEAMSMDAGLLDAMGARGRAWIEHEFSWDRIAARMLESYRWVREGGTPPEWIRRD